MPKRIIRDGILTSDKFNELKKWEHEAFFFRLMLIVDDYGRYDGRPVVLRSAMYPMKLEMMRETNIERCLEALETAGLVRLYLVKGKRYLEIANFGQRIQSKPKWPGPTEIDGESPCFTVDHGGQPDSTSTVGVEDERGDEGGIDSSGDLPLRSCPIDEAEAVAFLQAECRAGSINLPPDEAETAARIFHAEAAGRGWIDSKGFPLADWKSALKAWGLRYAGNLEKNKQKKYPPKSRNSGTANNSTTSNYKL